MTSSGSYNINSTNGNATVTLLADYPTVDIAATNYTATDGESSTAFVIYRETYFTNGAPAKTVYYSISGTASNGVDFTPFLSGSVSIPAGQSACTIPITPSFHTNVVGTKELTLSLLANAAYAIGTNNSATIGLLQDAPTINVSASGPYATVAGQSRPISNYPQRRLEQLVDRKLHRVGHSRLRQRLHCPAHRGHFCSSIRPQRT